MNVTISHAACPTCDATAADCDEKLERAGEKCCPRCEHAPLAVRRECPGYDVCEEIPDPGDGLPCFATGCVPTRARAADVTKTGQPAPDVSKLRNWTPPPAPADVAPRPRPGTERTPAAAPAATAATAPMLAAGPRAVASINVVQMSDGRVVYSFSGDLTHVLGLVRRAEFETGRLLEQEHATAAAQRDELARAAAEAKHRRENGS